MECLLVRYYEIYLRSLGLDRERDGDFFREIADLYDRDEVQGLSVYRQHGDINRLRHILSVTYMSWRVAKAVGADEKQTARGAVLHDLFYYDWHDKSWSHRPHAYRHPGFALDNAKKLTDLTPVEADIIKKHMWPVTPMLPRYRESWIVSMADKYCATQECLAEWFPKYNARIMRDRAKAVASAGV